MFLLGKPDPWKLLKQKDLQGLLKALEHRDGDVRNGAAKALGLLGDIRAVEPLIAALRDKDGNVRRSAAKSLGELGDSRAVEPLIAVLASSDGYVYGFAATALGQLRDVRAAESLLRLVTMRQADTFAQYDVIAALEKLGDPSTIPALVAAVEPLIKVLVESGGEGRRYAARTLGALGDSRAVEPLIAALSYGDYAVREFAAKSLGALGDSRAVEPLIAALGTNYHAARRRVAEALGALGDSRAVEPLIAVLADANLSVREAAVEALGTIGDARAASALRAASGVSAEIVRHALERIGGADAEWTAKQEGQKTLMQERPAREEEIERLTTELITIGRSDGFLSMQPGGKFNEVMRHIRAREIGSRLDELGGFELMQAVGYAVARAFGPGSSQGRELDAAWNGIGGWHG